MKNLQTLLCGILLLFTCAISAQNTYTVNGESVSLKTEVDGKLSLLWNIIDGEYRYFSKKDDAILELKNTKEDRNYKNEFRQTLATQIGDADLQTSNVNLTLSSLRKFYNSYNTLKDPSFVKATGPLKPVLRLGGFAGITNSNFTDNPTNSKQLQIGADLEVVDRDKFKRHAVVLRLANTFATSDYDYSAFQASLNYRYKFVMQSKFDFYLNLKYASYISFDSERLINQEGLPEPVLVETSGNNFSIPLSFGLGGDFALGNGHLTVLLNDLFGLNIDSNDEFPTNILLGYKFEL